ncbi:Cupredoxin [Jimgerdemannia flammicorona]|uniref:Cupredoxin n=1 Tax=Jimgerdemannia flammicorona TaxID=994334 RepID=A0A433DDP4_9FUNG|nr:Cupredoxin [Jimgerdemannia flammicorona]
MNSARLRTCHYERLESDWYHAEIPLSLQSYLSLYNPTGVEPVPNSALINNNANTTFQFVPGKTYRLRIISMTALALFHFYIDGHVMDIIEVDGTDVNRQTVTSLVVATAQRYSVLVQAKNQTTTNYLMHADMDPMMFDAVPPTLNPTNVIYSANAPFLPTPPGDWSSVDDTTLVPVIPEGTAPPDNSYTLTADFQVYDDGINHGAFNNLPFQFPKTPSLFTELSMGTLATDPAVYGPNSGAIVLKYLNMIQIVLNNNDVGHHPFHLHGHKFQVIGRSDGLYNSSNPYPEPANPIRRDTVQVPAGGNVVIRFRADNPGVWLYVFSFPPSFNTPLPPFNVTCRLLYYLTPRSLHCHIQWHMEAGLAMPFIEAPERAQARIHLPQVFLDQCRELNINPMGNAAGNNGTDFSGLQSGPQMIVEFGSRAYGALAACVISAVIGMGTVIWYAKEDKIKKVE